MLESCASLEDESHLGVPSWAMPSGLRLRGGLQMHGKVLGSLQLSILGSFVINDGNFMHLPCIF